MRVIGRRASLLRLAHLRGVEQPAELRRLTPSHGLLLLRPPALLLGVGCLRNPDLVYSVMDAQQVRQLEQMYGPDTGSLGRKRASDTDLMMFGFYVGHNTGIAFQTFGSGIVVGAGPVMTLLYNGAVLGAVAGHLARAGHGERFFPFVVAHGAFELPALVFSGMEPSVTGLVDTLFRLTSTVK